MKNWILAAVIGLATCGQAWAWDDDALYGNPRGLTRAELERRERQREFDDMVDQMNQQQMVQNQKRSLKIQEQQLRIEKRRLELEEGRALGGGSVFGGDSILDEPALVP